MDKIEKIKLLFVGDGSYEMFAKALARAAEKIENVEADLFEYGDMNIKAIDRSDYLKRAEYHFCIGPDVSDINRQLVELYREKRHDIVFLYSAELIFSKTIAQLKRMGAYVAVYHNDNPFSPGAKKYRYRHYVRSLKLCDISYSFRKSNISDCEKNGAKVAKLLRGYYMNSRNYYIDDSQIDLEVPDVCFIGHYENDGRLEYIKGLLAEGITVGVPEDWKNIGNSDTKLVYISDTHKNYNEILNKTKIAIVFLSHLNEDTYTTRCFEIPAVKTMMVAPYNDDMATLYLDGKEAVLYHNVNDFISKIKYYLQNESERAMIADYGYSRVVKDKHEAKDRVIEVINDWRMLTDGK